VVVEKEEDEARLHALFTAEKGKTDDTACAYSTLLYSVLSAIYATAVTPRTE
jgi:hypothetical protein